MEWKYIILTIGSIYLIIDGILIFTEKKAKNINKHLIPRRFEIKNEKKFIRYIGFVINCMGIIFLLISIAFIFKNDSLIYLGIFLFITAPIIFLLVSIKFVRIK
ncbi:hypothetical protein [Vallitalea sp.]|jgi:hypothetical protein|uniref:hypothetical protein n=1 Tax=Vallitalea sp. TaxID=1882829 RepID=UPI0025D42027|nr:hypothetical protein [Vallitalea sp.]MCT4686655.1 hypothetical protein [Vallitalea sp.]